MLGQPVLIESMNDKMIECMIPSVATSHDRAAKF